MNNREVATASLSKAIRPKCVREWERDHLISFLDMEEGDLDCLQGRINNIQFAADYLPAPHMFAELSLLAHRISVP